MLSQKYFNEVEIKSNNKNVLKPKFRAMSKTILPEIVINMLKKGFTMPLAEWLSVVETEKTDTNLVAQKWYMLSLQNNKERLAVWSS